MCKNLKQTLVKIFFSLRWQREVGLLYKSANDWLKKTEKCTEQVAHFTTVGLIESKPAFIVMLIGIGLSAGAYLLEIFVHRAEILHLRYKLNQVRTFRSFN